MIIEVADIRIQPGQQVPFEAALQKAIDTVLSKAKGFRRFVVHKGIESADRYLLIVHWETLEDHTVGFRESSAFTDWRALIGGFFAALPVVEHFNPLSRSPKPEGAGGAAGKSAKGGKPGKGGLAAKAGAKKPGSPAAKSGVPSGDESED